MKARRKFLLFVLGAAGLVAVLLSFLVFLAPRLLNVAAVKSRVLSEIGEADGGPALLRTGGVRLLPAPKAVARGSVPFRPGAGGRDGEASRGGHFAALPVPEPGPDRVAPRGGSGNPGADPGEGEKGETSLSRRDRGNDLLPPCPAWDARAGRDRHRPGRSPGPFRRGTPPPVACGTSRQALRFRRTVSGCGFPALRSTGTAWKSKARSVRKGSGRSGPTCPGRSPPWSCAGVPGPLPCGGRR